MASPRCSSTRARYQSACHGHRLAVEQRLDDDHLPLEAAGLDRSGGGRGEERPEQQRSLGVDRGAVGVAELVPHVEVGGRHLVPVVGLGGEEPPVVDLHGVARPELPEDLRARRAEHGDVADDLDDRQPGADRRPRHDDERRPRGSPPGRARQADGHEPRPGPVGALPRRVDPAVGLARLPPDRQARSRRRRRAVITATTSHGCCTTWDRSDAAVVAEVAGLGPEVLEVGGIGHAHGAVEHREGVHAHGAVAEPRPGREAHPGHLEEGGPLLVVEAGEHVAAPARLDGVDDLVEPVAQHPLRVHADREHVRDRHRRPDDVGDEAVPHAGGVLGAADRAEAAAAAAVGVAVRAGARRTSSAATARECRAAAALARYAAMVGSTDEPGPADRPPPLVSRK